MEITLTVTVKVNSDAWSSEYGVEDTPAAIREDMANYTQNIIWNEINRTDPGVEVTVQ